MKEQKYTGDSKQISRNGKVILHVDPAGDLTGFGRAALSKRICHELNAADAMLAMLKKLSNGLSVSGRKHYGVDEVIAQATGKAVQS